MSGKNERPFAKPRRGQVNPFFHSKATPYVGRESVTDADGWEGIAHIERSLASQYGERANMKQATAAHLIRAISWLSLKAGMEDRTALWNLRGAIDDLNQEKRRYQRRIARLNVEHLRKRLSQVRWAVAKEMRKLRAIRKTIRLERSGPRVFNRTVLAESHTEHAVRKVYIYGLVASDKPGVVEYVGQTYSPHSRLEAHRKSPMQSVASFFSNVHYRGACVQMVLIEEATRENANARETYFISLYHAAGMARLNTAGVYWTSKETIGRAA